MQPSFAKASEGILRSPLSSEGWRRGESKFPHNLMILGLFYDC